MTLTIDITGFIKPYMMRLFLCLMSRGVKKIDVLYSEPGKYAEKEKTKFSGDYVKDVHMVPGFGNIYNVKTDNDVLIIGAGYDDHLITSVATEKSHARKVQIFGLPSLRADMYQENILRAHKAGEAVDGRVGVDVDNYFSPANNPFITAETLSQVYNEINSEKEITNLYLSPLSTKPQALGFTIFYLTECLDKPVSMLYPYCDEHVQKTSTGISRIWKYVVEFVD